MSAKIFLKIGNIKGESTDSKHKDEIEVFGWTWGVTNAASTGPGGSGGSGSGRPTFSDLSFTHRYDKAAPLLWRACAVGQHFPEATLAGAKQGKAGDYLVIKMSDVVVTSANASDAAGGDAMESVSVKFSKVDVEYKPQKADGSLGPSVRFKYDIATNKEF